MSEDKPGESKLLHENGLLVMSIIAGFTLTGLLTVVGNPADFEPSSLNFLSSFGVPASEVFYDELVIFLGTISSLSLVTTLFLWLFSSVLEPKRFPLLSRFAAYAPVGILVILAAGLAYLVQPFSKFSGLILTDFWTILTIVIALIVVLDLILAKPKNEEQEERRPPEEKDNRVNDEAIPSAETEEQWQGCDDD